MRGLERGLERAGVKMRVAAFLEIEAFIIENLVSAMEAGFLDPSPVWTNIKTFDPEPFRGKVHGIVGGYPCQPFSLAGQQKGVEDSRHLWPYIKSHIQVIRPRWCFFENVANHLNIGYEIVRGELQEMGYSVEEGIYSAEEVGAPHRRERVFILAIMGDAKGENCAGLCLRASEAQSCACESGGDAREHAVGHNIDCVFSRLQGMWECGTKEGRKVEDGQSGSGGALLSAVVGVGHNDSDNCGSRKDFLRPELRTDRAFESSGNGWSAATCEGDERSKGNKWPARPGEEQYEWEEPRVESRLGFTINGYNFREDLLRMAGNGVVEQTSESAFIDLLKKHKKYGIYGTDA